MTEKQQQIQARYNALPEQIKNHIAVKRAFDRIKTFEDLHEIASDEIQHLIPPIIDEIYIALDEILCLVELCALIDEIRTNSKL